MVDVQYRNHSRKQALITVLCLFDVDAWHLMLNPEKFDVETLDPSGITECCNHWNYWLEFEETLLKRHSQKCFSELYVRVISNYAMRLWSFALYYCWRLSRRQTLCLSKCQCFARIRDCWLGMSARFNQFFLRKMLGTRYGYGSVGTQFSNLGARIRSLKNLP